MRLKNRRNMQKRRDDLGNGYFVWQDPEMFRFGIDAVLLAHFPEIRNGDRVLDLCTGFAPIPLIMYAEAEKEGRQRVSFSGIEIQERAASLAALSVKDNGLDERIRIVRGDLKEAEDIFGADSFSLITCNPPYRKTGSGIGSANEAERIAREELKCTLEDVIRVSAKLLVPKGRLAMVHRPERLTELLHLLREYRIEPKRLRMVHSLPDREASMVLVEAVRGGRPEMRVLPPLIVYGPDGNYTSEILRIYGME